jgi:hypothetical protein
MGEASRAKIGTEHTGQNKGLTAADLWFTAAVQKHRELLALDADYRFECACCGETVVFQRMSLYDLNERLTQAKCP